MNNTTKNTVFAAAIIAALSPLADFDNVKDYNDEVGSANSIAELTKLQGKPIKQERKAIQQCLQEKIESLKCKTIKNNVTKLKM